MLHTGKTDTLTKLDVSWNHLRLEGAIAVGQGLKVSTLGKS